MKFIQPLQKDKKLACLFGAILVVFVMLAAAIIRTAWISDDAMIAFRSTLNLAHGLGLVYNPDIRVQAFSNPLWTIGLVVPYWLTGKLFLSAIWLSVLFSLLAVFLGVRRFSGWPHAPINPLLSLFMVIAPLSSKAFVDYATSGLENALAYLLVTLTVLTLLDGQKNSRTAICKLVFLTALVFVNRMDHALLVAPAVAYILYINRDMAWSLVRPVFTGALPALGWLLFSIVYYGFPFPNTYYAKLNTGIAFADYLAEGLNYYQDSLVHDPATLVVVVAGLIVAITNKTQPVLRALAFGLLLYLLYIFKIGGDFMSGRFFAVPLWMAVLLFCASYPRFKQAGWALIIILISCLSLVNTVPPVFYDYALTTQPAPANIIDERATWFEKSGLFSPKRRFPQLQKIWQHALAAPRPQPVPVIIYRYLGSYGLYKGPFVHILDRYALADPLLARIAVHRKDRWRIGHFIRRIPGGYAQTLATGQNVIEYGPLAFYYSKLAQITRQPVFSLRRFAEIAAMNIGFYNKLTKDLDLIMPIFEKNDRMPITVERN